MASIKELLNEFIVEIIFIVILFLGFLYFKNGNFTDFSIWYSSPNHIQYYILAILIIIGIIIFTKTKKK